MCPLIQRSHAHPSRPSGSEAVANGAKQARVSKEEANIGASWFSR
jgi:hypothetical protein